MKAYLKILIIGVIFSLIGFLTPPINSVTIIIGFSLIMLGFGLMVVSGIIRFPRFFNRPWFPDAGQG